MHPILTIFGHSFTAYALFNYFGVIVVFSVSSIFFLRYRGLTWTKSLLLTLATNIITYLGGKAGHYIAYYDEYQKGQIGFFSNLNSFLVTGIIAAIFCVWVLSALMKEKPFRVLDAMAPGAALTVGIAKIGCFLTGCCGGIHSSMPWAMVFPGTTIPVHPVQIYESVFGFVMAAWLIYKTEKGNEPDGSLIMTFGGAYCLFRFFIFYLREPPAGAAGTALAPVLFVMLAGFFFSYLFFPALKGGRIK
ncbi:MAG: prolipoprotein diacylglyceryl transferase [Solirubrobacterales bacterium]